MAYLLRPDVTGDGANHLMMSDDEMETVYALLTSASEDGLVGELRRHVDQVREAIFRAYYSADGSDTGFRSPENQARIAELLGLKEGER